MTITNLLRTEFNRQVLNLINNGYEIEPTNYCTSSFERFTLLYNAQDNTSAIVYIRLTYDARIHNSAHVAYIGTRIVQNMNSNFAFTRENDYTEIDCRKYYHFEYHMRNGQHTRCDKYVPAELINVDDMIRKQQERMNARYSNNKKKCSDKMITLAYHILRNKKGFTNVRKMDITGVEHVYNGYTIKCTVNGSIKNHRVYFPCD